MLSTFSFLGQVKSPLFPPGACLLFIKLPLWIHDHMATQQSFHHLLELRTSLRRTVQHRYRYLVCQRDLCGCEPLTLSAMDRSHHLRLPLDKNCFASDVQWMPERAWDLKAVKPDSSLFHTHMHNKLLEV